jgi:hypothetical protein
VPVPLKPSAAINDNGMVTGETTDGDMITINRTYTFAGKIHTETKTVPRSSAQAQAYLATKDLRAGAEDETVNERLVLERKVKKGPDGQVLFRPNRRISAWDPNPDGFIKGMPSTTSVATNTSTLREGALKIIDKEHLGRDAALWTRMIPELTSKLRWVTFKSNSVEPTSESAISRQLKAQRLNVVDKSKLDWAEHVDATEGARDELEKAKKDKTSYLERRDFLDRVEDHKEDERAKARGVIR